MILNKEACDIRLNFLEAAKKWAEENIEQVAKSHGLKHKGWIEEVRVEDDELFIHTMCGPTCAGQGDSEYYYLPFQYIYDAEFRENYPQYLIDKEIEKNRLEQERLKARKEMDEESEKQYFKRLKAKYEPQ